MLQWYGYSSIHTEWLRMRGGVVGWGGFGEIKIDVPLYSKQEELCMCCSRLMGRNIINHSSWMLLNDKRSAHQKVFYLRYFAISWAISILRPTSYDFKFINEPRFGLVNFIFHFIYTGIPRLMLPHIWYIYLQGFIHLWCIFNEKGDVSLCNR